MGLEKVVKKLANELWAAALEIEEMGCTCVDRTEGHQRNCSGVRHSKDYFKLAEKYRESVAEDPVKEERRRIREALGAAFREIASLTPGEGGRGDGWVDAARNMYEAALRAVRR